MLTKRIIPCLDVRNGRVVKGVNFDGIKDVADPIELADLYSQSGADELVFYDITASVEGRGIFLDVLKRTAERVFIPLTVGGGINTSDDFSRVLDSGADKVSVNSGAIADPKIIDNAAAKFGNQCVVLSMDVKRTDKGLTVFSHGGRHVTQLNAVDWARYGAEHGAGEIVVNSIDTDGVKRGFDLEMLDLISSAVNVPIVASGGAGSAQDFVTLFKSVNVDAGLGASVFHFGELSIYELKTVLKNNGIPVRL